MTNPQSCGRAMQMPAYLGEVLHHRLGYFTLLTLAVDDLEGGAGDG